MMLDKIVFINDIDIADYCYWYCGAHFALTKTNINFNIISEYIFRFYCLLSYEPPI